MENYGTLVGWTHCDLGDRTMLNVKSVQTMAAAKRHEPDVTTLMVTRNQAALLGTYLLKVSGHAAPERSSWFRRMFG